MINVFREIFKLYITYVFYPLLIIAIVLYFTHEVDLQYLVTVLCFILFWFYYEINAKDLQLRERNKLPDAKDK